MSDYQDQPDYRQEPPPPPVRRPSDPFEPEPPLTQSQREKNRQHIRQLLEDFRARRLPPADPQAELPLNRPEADPEPAEEQE